MSSRGLVVHATSDLTSTGRLPYVPRRTEFSPIAFEAPSTICGIASQLGLTLMYQYDMYEVSPL